MSQKKPDQMYLVRALRGTEEKFMCIVRGDDETDKVLETGELHCPAWDWLVDQVSVMDARMVDEMLYEPESQATLDDDIAQEVYREWKATRGNPPEYDNPADPRTSAFWDNVELSRGDE